MTLDGLWLFLVVCSLTASVYAFPGLGYWPLLALLVLMALTPARGRR